MARGISEYIINTATGATTSTVGASYPFGFQASTIHFTNNGPNTLYYTLNSTTASTGNMQLACGASINQVFPLASVITVSWGTSTGLPSYSIGAWGG